MSNRLYKEKRVRETHFYFSISTGTLTQNIIKPSTDEQIASVGIHSSVKLPMNESHSTKIEPSNSRRLAAVPSTQCLQPFICSSITIGV